MAIRPRQTRKLDQWRAMDAPRLQNLGSNGRLCGPALLRGVDLADVLTVQVVELKDRNLLYGTLTYSG
jgi:hypothetical protein